jgi:uncharacterized coiled-coil protein SlyX
MPQSVEQRIETLEITVAHLQRLNEQLNEVVTRQSLEADQMTRRIERLEALAKDLKEKQQSQEPFDPLDEKPPHY